MSDATARLALPFLAPGQAQKELFHNEALVRLDTTLHPVAQTIGDESPPGSPVPGQCWITGAAPTGEWAGQARALAAWTEGGWRFVRPVAGMMVWLPGNAVYARYDGSAWRIGEIVGNGLILGGVQVVGTQQPTIASPTGGTTPDPESRGAIAAIIATLEAHGLIAS